MDSFLIFFTCQAREAFLHGDLWTLVQKAKAEATRPLEVGSRTCTMSLPSHFVTQNESRGQRRFTLKTNNLLMCIMNLFGEM